MGVEIDAKSLNKNNLCKICRKTFKSLETLNEHLKSKKHLEKAKHETNF